ncbi:unnamed protein product, partial [Brassica rapa]
PPSIPTTEEVLEEIREETIQYTIVADPIERAARMKRVLQSELDGSVEETVAGIIKASSMALNLPLLVPLSIPQAQLTTMKSTSRPITAQSQNTRKRSRPAKTRDIKISPKFFVGSSSRKRNMVKGMASPSNS